MTADTGKIYVHSVKTGKRLREFDFAEDGKRKYGSMRLATAGSALTARGSAWDGTINKLRGRLTVWDLATGTMRKRADFLGSFMSMYSPDGKVFHLVDHSRLHDPLNDKEVLKLVEKGYGPWDFTADGKQLAIGCYQTNARGENLADAVSIYDLATGRELGRTATGRIGDVCFSPSGKILASASRDELSLWEIASGQRVLRLPAPPGHSAADCVAFGTPMAYSPDGTSVATALRDTTVLIWDVAPGWRQN